MGGGNNQQASYVLNFIKTSNIASQNIPTKEQAKGMWTRRNNN